MRMLRTPVVLHTAGLFTFAALFPAQADSLEVGTVASDIGDTLSVQSLVPGDATLIAPAVARSTDGVIYYLGSGLGFDNPVRITEVGSVTPSGACEFRLSETHLPSAASDGLVTITSEESFDPRSCELTFLSQAFSSAARVPSAYSAYVSPGGISTQAVSDAVTRTKSIKTVYRDPANLAVNWASA
jgi:hypothetical protein